MRGFPIRRSWWSVPWIPEQDYFKALKSWKNARLGIGKPSTHGNRTHLPKEMIKFLTDKKNKNHLTGYLTYTAGIDATYYNLSTGTGTNTVKITVTVKDAAAVQYVAEGKPEIAKKATTSTTITLNEKKSKQPANIKYAIIGEGNAAAEWAVTANANGTLTLSRTEDDLKINKSYTIPIVVLPAASLYAAELVSEDSEEEDFDSAAAIAANQKVVKDYGVKVSISVKAVEYKSALTVAKEKLEAWMKGEDINKSLNNT